MTQPPPLPAPQAVLPLQYAKAEPIYGPTQKIAAIGGIFTAAGLLIGAAGEATLFLTSTAPPFLPPIRGVLALVLLTGSIACLRNRKWGRILFVIGLALFLSSHLLIGVYASLMTDIPSQYRWYMLANLIAGLVGALGSSGVLAVIMLRREHRV